MDEDDNSKFRIERVKVIVASTVLLCVLRTRTFEGERIFKFTRLTYVLILKKYKLRNFYLVEVVVRETTSSGRKFYNLALPADTVVAVKALFCATNCAVGRVVEVNT